MWVLESERRDVPVWVSNENDLKKINMVLFYSSSTHEPHSYITVKAPVITSLFQVSEYRKGLKEWGKRHLPIFFSFFFN